MSDKAARNGIKRATNIYRFVFVILVALSINDAFYIFQNSEPSWNYVLYNYVNISILVPPFLIYTIGTMIRGAGRVRALQVGVIAAYIVLVIEDFANLYKYFGLVMASSNAIVHNGIIAVYFSAITLTTVGYGDFYPANTYGRVFSAYEALMGYFLLAITAAFFAQLFSRPNLADALIQHALDVRRPKQPDAPADSHTDPV